MSTCKSCGAPVRWARTDAGKNIPIDPDPRPDGNIQLVDAGTHLAARVGAAGSGSHVAHFVTCPNANGHHQERRR
jgi:hypothetical protein